MLDADQLINQTFVGQLSKEGGCEVNISIDNDKAVYRRARHDVVHGRALFGVVLFPPSKEEICQFSSMITFAEYAGE